MRDVISSCRLEPNVEEDYVDPGKGRVSRAKSSSTGYVSNFHAKTSSIYYIANAVSRLKTTLIKNGFD